MIFLTRREVSTLIRLLGVLQTNLEAAIDSNTVGETGKPMAGDRDSAQNLRMDRRDWRLAEDLVMKLDRIRKRSKSDPTFAKNSPYKAASGRMVRKGRKSR
jgi:hypothetical protein